LKIVDFRNRPQTRPMIEIQENDHFKQHIVDLGHEFLPERPLDAWMADLVAADVELAVVPGRDIETTYGFRISNDYVAEVARADPDRIIGYAGIDPNKGRQAIEELERCRTELGLKGVALSPYMHRAPANDRRLYYPIYDYCEEYDLDVSVISGPGTGVPGSVIAHAAPMLLDEVARDFPRLTIVVGLGGYPWILETITLANRWERVFFDFSVYEYMPGMSLYTEAGNGALREKWLFASSSPYVTVQKARAAYEEAFDLTPEATQAVMHDNGWKLLTRERRAGTTWSPGP
jgi:predicted TIM-barrel fold metal-dependent hydrolase